MQVMYLSTPDLSKTDETHITLYDLNGSVCRLADGYYPNTASRDGETVLDRFDVIISGSGATIQDNVQMIERCLEQGNLGRPGFEVYLNWRVEPGSGAPTTWKWQSRIRRGVVLFNRNLARRWSQGQTKLTIEIERDNFWEGPLNNVRGSSPQGDGVDHYYHLNSNDGAGVGPFRYNYIDFPDNELLTGNALPSPIYMIVTNPSESAKGVGDIFINLNTYSHPETLNYRLEGEDGAGGTNTVSATCSGGSYKALSWSGTNEAELISWTLPNAVNDLDQYNNGFFKLLTRFAATFAYSDLWLRFGIKMGGVVVSESPYTLMSANKTIQDAGTLQIMPFRYKGYNSQVATLTLYAKRYTSGSHSINLDFVHLACLDGWRHFKPITGLAPGVTLVDDTVNGSVYSRSVGSSTAISVTHVGYGAPLMYTPGRAMRLSSLFNYTDGSAPIDAALSIGHMIRPRKRGL